MPWALRRPSNIAQISWHKYWY